MLDRPDLISVLETAYDVEGTDTAWLQRLTDAVKQATGAELGCASFYLDASDLAQLRVQPAVSSQGAPAVDIARFFAPRSAEDLRPLFRSSPVGTTSAQLGRARWKQVRGELGPLWPTGVEDTVGIVAFDAGRRGCVINIGLPRMRRLRRDEQVRYSRLGMHIAAALRARRALAGEPIRADLGRGNEALLEPGGRVLDAEGSAAESDARYELREMARRVDRARTRQGRKDADLALEAWTALVSGRWTLLDHFDTDGRRFLVARKNPPDLVEPLRLEARERMVASAIALGHPQKLVSYELGLKPGTVARLLRSALSKLGLRTPAELASVLGSFVPSE